MNTQFSFLVTVLLMLSGCVSKTEYDRLRDENEQLKQELETLKTEKKEQEEREWQARLQERSEEEALSLIKDYYEFYNANSIYRKPKVRRMSSNKFRISLEECPKKGGFSDQDFFWHSRVLTLTINVDGTYTVD